MNCPECNKCIDCGEVYWDDPEGYGNDNCPHCVINKDNCFKSKREAMDFILRIAWVGVDCGSFTLKERDQVIARLNDATAKLKED